MNKKEVNKRIKEVYNKYHLPGCSNLHKRKINACFFSPANSLKHELLKAKTCYEILSNGGKFITEACRNRKDDNGKIRRVDIVDLSANIEFEIELNPKRAERFKGEEGVIVIKGWEQ